MSTLVIIPTYNEITNIAALVPAVLEADPDFNVLVVDDASPDGTGEFIERISESERRVKLLRRRRKSGLGSAYMEGFRFAVKKNFGAIIQMDADFSHDPSDLKRLVSSSEGCGLVIGSRYVAGGASKGRSSWRTLLSRTAAMYASFLSGAPIKDMNGGFKWACIDAVSVVLSRGVISTGFAFQMETNYIIWKSGFKIAEIPITFSERKAGRSKLTMGVILESAIVPLRILAGSNLYS